MKKLIQAVETLKPIIKTTVDTRIKEFEAIITNEDIFNELCFCLLTANFSAARGIQIQYIIGDGFLNLPEDKLAEKLKQLGHRFPNARSKYIVEARKHKNSLKNLKRGNEHKSREWLVENIKGLGYKESSHFLRNIGRTDLAIIDFHIINLLVKHKLVEKPKTLTKKKYLDIENLLRKIAEKTNLTLAELDLYLWFTETGKVLK